MITVYGDLACPFATLTLYGLRAARQRLGLDVAFDIRPFPLELINERPHRRSLVEAEKATLLAVEPALGWRPWPFDECAGWPVTTLLPLAAVMAARRPAVGGLAASDALDAALRRAFYVEGRCIALLHVVLETARGCPEVNADTLAEELRAGVGLSDVVDAAAPDRVARASPHIFGPRGREWVNPGIELDQDTDAPTVTDYDPGVYEQILLAAA
ncbi:MAG TPA: hypothetical protein VFC00_16435 [Micromonosporaceae bacterium]|nr:hypothetical protein [Micromonosporaceae bacterium]